MLDLDMILSVMIGVLVASTLGIYVSFLVFKHFLKGRVIGTIKEMALKIAGIKLEKVEYFEIHIIKEKKEIEAKVKIRLK